MSWSSTYTHAIAIAADMLGAAFLWSNRVADVTISSVCGIELRKAAKGMTPVSGRLVVLGRALNAIDTDHCEKALEADLERLDTARAFLTSVSR